MSATTNFSEYSSEICDAYPSMTECRIDLWLANLTSLSSGLDRRYRAFDRPAPISRSQFKHQVKHQLEILSHPYQSRLEAISKSAERQMTKQMSLAELEPEPATKLNWSNRFMPREF